jgi:hypothetical protein
LGIDDQKPVMERNLQLLAKRHGLMCAALSAQGTRRAVAMTDRLGKSQRRNPHDVSLLMFEGCEGGRFELCEKSQLRFFRRAAGMPLYRSLPKAPCFDRLEIAPQVSAVLSDLVASLATIEWREQRVRQSAPCDSQQFLQSVYGAEQIVWRCHPRSLSK